MLLKPLPVPNPGALVVLAVRDPSSPNELQTRFSYPVLETLRARNQVFSGPFTYVSGPLKLDRNGEAEQITAALVSGDYFQALGVTAERGRTFSEADDLKGDPHSVAVISHRLWQRRFGGNPDLIGRVVRLNGYPVTIIGIMGSDFFGTQVGIAAEMWAPIRLMSRLSLPGTMLDKREATWLPAMARLRPGMSRERAEAAADALCHQIFTEASTERDSADRPHLVLLSGSRGFSKLQQQFSKPLLALGLLVVLVLLIACANVANLLLARATARQKEIALRLAIGASRGRIISQLLTESTVLGIAGGALGILMAIGSTRLVVQVLPATRSLAPQIDWRVLMFCFTASIISGVLFGLAPAFETARSELAAAIKNAAVRSHSSRWLGVRDTLLTAQVASAVVLLISASLFVSTLRNLHSADSGFRSDNILQLSINPRQAGFSADRMQSFYDRLLERVRALPGAHGASFIDSGFMSGGNQNEDLYPPGYQPGPSENVFSAFNVVAPGFFETLGIARLQGREFDARDNASAPNVAIVNEPYARHFFGNQNSIGQHIGVAGKPEMEIVGVVRATKLKTMRDASPRIVYMPFAQVGFGQATLYVQTRVDPVSLVAPIRQIVSDLDRDAAVYDIKTLSEQIDESMAQERLVAWIASFFGLFALALAATGLYGVISYKVSRRTKEIGVRMALGAQPSQILGSVLRESLLVTISGMAFGTLGALITTRFIVSLLYGLSPQDPFALGMSAAVMLAAAALAAYVPANRASRIDPMVALRYE
jgi:predicted permease